MTYLYPDNLKQKATMWLWTLGDLAVIVIAALLSILLLSQAGISFPLVLTALYAFLSIQMDGASVKDFLRRTINFFITKPQQFYWTERC